MRPPSRARCVSGFIFPGLRPELASSRLRRPEIPDGRHRFTACQQTPFHGLPVDEVTDFRSHEVFVALLSGVIADLEHLFAIMQDVEQTERVQSSQRQ
jgi:hypothetical protein